MNRVGGRGGKKPCGNIFSNFSQFFLSFAIELRMRKPLGIEGISFFPEAGMDKEEGEQFRSLDFYFLFLFSLQWIGGWEDCHLDSAGKGKDENSQSTFK